jgi:thioredoxin-like negative regulator of GroEL
VLAGIVLVAIALGLLHTFFNGRQRRISGEQIVAIDGLELGADATLLQFSTEMCAPCAATKQVLTGFATPSGSVIHAEIDVTNRPDLIARFNLMQTPTTFVLDRDGLLKARFGGAVRRDLVSAELDSVLATRLSA